MRRIITLTILFQLCFAGQAMAVRIDDGARAVEKEIVTEKEQVKPVKKETSRLIGGKASSGGTFSRLFGNPAFWCILAMGAVAFTLKKEKLEQ